MSVLDRDMGWEAIKRELERAARGEVTVGIHADEDAADGALTTAQVGAFHEFGVGVPQRSFLAPTIDEKAKELHDLADRLYWGPILRGQTTARKGLATIGQVAQDAIKAKVRDSDPRWPPLAEGTKAAKSRTIRGSSRRPKSFDTKHGRRVWRRLSAAHKAASRRAEFIAGDGNPLVDTGQLLNSIRFKVNVGVAGDA